jgi:hypothetical protein
MSNSTLPLVEHLYRALESDIGIVVKTNNPELLRNRLYAARQQAQNPAFEALTLMFSRSNPKTELWIAKNQKAEPNGR